MEGQLKAVDGVESATCDYSTKIATVKVRSDVDASKLIESLEAPYAATVKQ